MNQYHTWGSNPATYDEDVGGWGSPQHANGVLMQEGNVTAGYNSLNQMVMVAGTSNWIFFGYDPLGRRVKQWTGGLTGTNLVPEPGDSTATYFYYDGWDLIQEGPSATVASRNYIHGARVDEIVKQITPGNWWERYFHYDARGHCSLQTDAGGNIVEQYDYDAFGQPYFYDWAGTALVQYDSATGQWEGYSPWGNRFLFTGREWLSDTGASAPHNLKLYDYRNRMYQPELGRFMSPDSKHFAAGDYNLYRYCHNDPVNKSDPFGLLEIALQMWKPVETGSNLVRLVEVKFQAYTSFIDAGKAGGKAASDPKDVAEHQGRVGQVTAAPRYYIYGPPIRGTHDSLMNYSNLRAGPLPEGVKDVASYWVLGRHQDEHSWPVNKITGKSDLTVLKEAHRSAVLTNPPPPGGKNFTYKVYDADRDTEGQ